MPETYKITVLVGVRRRRFVYEYPDEWTAGEVATGVLADGLRVDNDKGTDFYPPHQIMMVSVEREKE